MTALFVIAHPDDEVYGCGGTIIKERDAIVLCLCRGDKHGDSDKARVRQTAFRRNITAFRAMPILTYFDDFSLSDHYQDVIQIITEEVAAYRPTNVYTHSLSDIHQDHRIVAEATMVACRPTPTSSVRTLRMFETVSSTDWGFGKFNQFKPDHYVDITIELDTKIEAASRYIGEEIREHPDCRSIQAIHNLAAYRGQQVGMPYAEAFETVYSFG